MPALPLFAINAIVMMAAALAFWLSGDLAPQAIAHIAFGLGILPLILAAIAYFVPVLTRSAGAPPQLLAVPLAAWLGATCIVAAFAGAFDLTAASHAAFTLAAGAAIVLLLWIVRRTRSAVGSPHPCLNWYLAALACLILALLAVPAMALWPAQRIPLRIFHMHLNLLGFVGLTALGTLQVLLPTAAGRADPAAAQRLSSDLKFALAGALLIAGGAAFSKPLALLGVALFAIAPLRMGSAWVRLFADRIFRLHGAASSLALAALGLLGLLAAGLAHAYGMIPGRPAIGGFVVAFLLPLVSGAATQLFPVWLRPGPQGPWHGSLRDALGRLAGVRALLMVGGGIAIACGWPQGFWAAFAGVAIFALSALTTGKNLRH